VKGLVWFVRSLKAGWTSVLRSLLPLTWVIHPHRWDGAKSSNIITCTETSKARSRRGIYKRDSSVYSSLVSRKEKSFLGISRKFHFSTPQWEPVPTALPLSGKVGKWLSSKGKSSRKSGSQIFISVLVFTLENCLEDPRQLCLCGLYLLTLVMLKIKTHILKIFTNLLKIIKIHVNIKYCKKKLFFRTKAARRMMGLMFCKSTYCLV
jgi:hypothetical protein